MVATATTRPKDRSSTSATAGIGSCALQGASRRVGNWPCARRVPMVHTRARQYCDRERPASTAPIRVVGYTLLKARTGSCTFRTKVLMDVSFTCSLLTGAADGLSWARMVNPCSHIASQRLHRHRLWSLHRRVTSSMSPHWACNGNGRLITTNTLACPLPKVTSDCSPGNSRNRPNCRMKRFPISGLCQTYSCRNYLPKTSRSLPRYAWLPRLSTSVAASS